MQQRSGVLLPESTLYKAQPIQDWPSKKHVMIVAFHSKPLYLIFNEFLLAAFTVMLMLCQSQRREGSCSKLRHCGCAVAQALPATRSSDDIGDVWTLLASTVSGPWKKIGGVSICSLHTSQMAMVSAERTHILLHSGSSAVPSLLRSFLLCSVYTSSPRHHCKLNPGPISNRSNPRRSTTQKVVAVLCCSPASVFPETVHLSSSVAYLDLMFGY